MKTLWSKIKIFFKKYGIDAVIAIIIWYAPSWLAFFIPSLKDFAILWLGLLASPLIPVVLVVPVTAVFIHWLRHKIWQLSLYIRDMLDKVRIQNKFSLYFTIDQMRLIEAKGKKLYEQKMSDKEKFKNEQEEKYLNLIKNDWEEVLPKEEE